MENKTFFGERTQAGAARTSNADAVCLKDGSGINRAKIRMNELNCA
jgi:hypothetical protein